jgi:L-threonylcarbamoyladenylate synthase
LRIELSSRGNSVIIARQKVIFSGRVVLAGGNDTVPKLVKVDPDRPEPRVIQRAAKLLRRGGVVGYPTETSYGLGADVLNREACDRIFAMKGRDPEKALSVIVPDLDQVASLCHPVPLPVRLLAERFWPGPLTLVVPLRPELGQALRGESSVAVRVSGLAVARELARAAGCSLTATSANRSGEPPARSADEVSKTFGPQLDLILDGGGTFGSRPSTIVDLLGRKPRLLREGPVDFGEVLQALRGRPSP